MAFIKPGRDPSDKRAKIGIAVLGAVLGFAAVYFTATPRDNAQTEPPAGTSGSLATGADKLNTGKMTAFVFAADRPPLPDIAFQDANGTETSLSKLKGRTVLLNLWATWCAPCREEMPSLDRLQTAMGGADFEVAALSIDRQGLAASKKFMTEINTNAIKLYVDPTGKQGTPLKLTGMPTTILIDRDGHEIGRLAGTAEWDSADAKRLIQSILDKK